MLFKTDVFLFCSYWLSLLHNLDCSKKVFSKFWLKIWAYLFCDKTVNIFCEKALLKHGSPLFSKIGLFEYGFSQMWLKLWAYFFGIKLWTFFVKSMFFFNFSLLPPLDCAKCSPNIWLKLWAKLFLGDKTVHSFFFEKKHLFLKIKKFSLFPKIGSFERGISKIWLKLRAWLFLGSNCELFC